MPKSASRTLLKRLNAYVVSRIIDPKWSGGVGHLQIDPEALWPANVSIFDRKIPIVYQHFFPTEKNRQTLVRGLNVTGRPAVTVLVRNIYDVAISCEDHQWNSRGPWWVRRDENSFFKPRGNDSPSHSHIWNVMICIKFYASWVVAGKSGEWDVMFVEYDDVIQNPVKTLDSILKHSDVRSVNVCGSKIEGISDNVNKGESGRGMMLDPFYREMIQKFADSFEGIDFKPIGITST